MSAYRLCCIYKIEMGFRLLLHNLPFCTEGLRPSLFENLQKLSLSHGHVTFAQVKLLSQRKGKKQINNLTTINSRLCFLFLFSFFMFDRWSARSCVEEHRYICQHRMPYVTEKNRQKIYNKWNVTYPNQLANEKEVVLSDDELQR